MPNIIYGALSFAMSIYTALKAKNIPVLCFAVSDTLGNPETIDGIPVIKLENLLEYKDSATVFIAVSLAPASLQEEIIENLRKNEFKNIVPLTNQSLNETLFNYYSASNDILLLPPQSETNDENSEMEILRVTSSYDKPLRNSYEFPNYIKTFFNDSPKARNYCELMAAYYLWKNSGAKIKGICHYRRIFTRVHFEPDTDVILPMPLVFYPNIDAQRKRFISDEDWNAVFLVIKEIYPQCLESIRQIFSGKILYSFNMVAAKSEIFNDYCEWLFAILERVESIRGDETVRQDRYLGYIGECLMNFYFQHNKDKLRILHTGMEWLA
jgi:hypothetical protein